MPTANIRQKLHNFIDTIEDKRVKAIYTLFEDEIEQEGDWWDELPVEVQKEVDQALAELDKGKGIPHEQVMKKYKKWFTR
ncbi:hypothetical protein [Dinghuibacter silviterrae]|uniref:Addiction module component n=1 Tax=Dinghuibacter silviterrae TaxID=1539049 RepID=A0A4R8DD77_9BACT|nr:hypothetical protein [Dinghuibacter silviterrae]TDW91902.1 hypothetical protein EDB95_5495 [Dinghuibacter silviterrae]